MPHLCLRFRLRGRSESMRSSSSNSSSSDQSESVYLDITSTEPSSKAKYQNNQNNKLKCSGWRVIRMSSGQDSLEDEREFAMICDIEIPRESTVTPSDDDDDKTEGLLDGDSVFGTGAN